MTKHYNYKDKQRNIDVMNQYMLAKTLSMFEWENLPETIPYKELEKMLQVNGYAFITKFNGELYCFTGGFSGKQDAYGNPTEIIISNPHLNFNATLNIKKDGVLIYNDDMGLGLMPLYTKHNTMLSENDINMTIWGYNSRTQRVISASDDRTKQSAEAYLSKVVDGEIGVIGENAILEGVKIHGASSSQGVSITTMIEYHQYLKASLYNEIGLSANFNMKRERLITSEVEAGEDSLFPFVFDMMKNRLHGIEKLNEMFDLDINIDFGSVWHFKNKELVDDVVDLNKLPDEANPNDLGGGGEDTQSPTPDTVTNDVNDLVKGDEELSDADKEALEELRKEQEDENTD